MTGGRSATSPTTCPGGDGSIPPVGAIYTLAGPSLVSSTLVGATLVGATFIGATPVGNRDSSAHFAAGAVASGPSTTPAVSSVLLGAWDSRPHPRPDPGFASHPTEQSGSRFLEDLELGVRLVDTELVEGCFLGLVEATSGGLNPLHLSVPYLPRLLRFRRPPARGRVPPRWPLVPGRFALAPFEDPPFWGDPLREAGVCGPPA